MGKRFLHNRAAVVTVAFVLLIALIAFLPRSWRRMIPMLRISSTNSRRTAWSTHWAQTIWAGASSPA